MLTVSSTPKYDVTARRLEFNSSVIDRNFMLIRDQIYAAFSVVIQHCSR